MSGSHASEQFRSAIERCSAMAHTARWLANAVHNGFAAADCNRAVVVLVVSALDTYVHDLCVEAGTLMAAGKRARTAAFSNLRVRIVAAERGLSDPTWLAAEIREAQGRETFQRPDAIAQALKIVDERPGIWLRVAARLGREAGEVRDHLNAIVSRRNMIAHEADMDPTWGRPRPLDASEAEVALDFIQKLVDAIDAEVW